MTATYTRLRQGDWGIRVTGAEVPAEGDTVTVRKKDGQERREVVLKVIWSGTGKYSGALEHLCAIVQRAAGAGRRRGKRHDGQPCANGCGARLNCSECGEWVNCGDGSRCWETGLAH